MKYYIPLFRIHVLFQVVILFTVLAVAKSLRPYYYIPETYNGKGTDIVGVENHTRPKNGARKEIGMELYPTGSSLPDCSHACGPCRPCKRVMVSLTCSTESCPVVYRCMCKGKYYHVPSN